MNIVALVDSFKHSFSSYDASQALKETLNEHDISVFPVADGGEGTTSILTDLYEGEYLYVDGVGPNGKYLRSRIGWIPKTRTAIIETAEGAGIQKVKQEELNPYKLSSFGVAVHIKQALEVGAEKIILGLGGSATIDCGFGLLCGLGVKFIDNDNRVMDPFDVRLFDIKEIDKSNLDERLAKVNIILASDVVNPLLGELGATAIFGAQKGLKNSMIEVYERGMAHCAHCYSKSFGADNSKVPGSGAAGWIGFALSMVSACEYVSGVDLILREQSIQQALNNADLVITGEGSVDSQSLNGKLISGVMEQCEKRGIPVLLVCGQYKLADKPKVIRDVIVISEDESNLESALGNGLINLKKKVKNYFEINQIRDES